MTCCTFLYLFVEGLRNHAVLILFIAVDYDVYNVRKLRKAFPLTFTKY